ncbi:MAG: hypothetical protein J5582_09425 [Ruminococcus sp.]|uniref:hypothetical protein n=1 Tax=Ruminococcus sp. TaxID=41978 RepID=UPI0025EAFFDE|nr:hypothetical protein [Ruminococcus sp.]MBO4866766.1 hypothetical protein [Ruminococcus sp.]
MKKYAALALALVMGLGMVACGDTGSSDTKDTTTKAGDTTTAAKSDEDKPDDAADETTTTEAPAEPLNENVVHKEFKNTVLNITANFDVANIEGFETTEATQTEDAYRASGSFTYPDPEYYAAAISASYNVRILSAEHAEAIVNKDLDYKNYEKVDIGSAYDTYEWVEDGSYGKRINIIFVGGDYLDGKYILEAEFIPQLESGKQEDVDLIVDTFAKSLKLEADDSGLKSGDTFQIGTGEGITCKNKATVAGKDVDMEQKIYMNCNSISAQTSFVADGIGYDFYTYTVDGMDHFGVMGGGEYADCTFAGKPGKIKISSGVGNIAVDADIQVDDNHCLHMSLDSDSALSEGELGDAVKLGEKIADMLSEDNKEATQELFVGYINDIAASLIFPEGGIAEN